MVGGEMSFWPAESLSQTRVKAKPVAPVRVKQGDLFYFSVRVDPHAASVQGELRHRTFPFFKAEAKGQFGALIGVDLADPPSREDLRVDVSKDDGSLEQRHYTVEVLPVHFETQELTVPKNYVDLDDETAKRAEEEQEKILQSLKKVTGQKYWDGRFIMPVEGKIAGSFGLRRIINGEPRSQHSGEDIKAPKGTEVLATNEGVVALVGDFFFSGKSIVMDHGLGLYTMYFHLDEVDVAEGERIHKGAVLGKVGATGRATGPHLHWGMRIDGARVNPLSVLNIE
jgi:murein DD-endopeptidase MepM/ murein hydrolase activator NlpD